ncbi:MAG: 2-phospho-L-lactate transferase CofD family protein [Desulfopila sp.]
MTGLREDVTGMMAALQNRRVPLLDLLPHDGLREKLIDLVVSGDPPHPSQEISRLFGELLELLESSRVDQARVVVFGGGTGLSNIIGGDCRSEGWAKTPFRGLKEVFPRTRSVVCVTDDGGSTGEMMKDLPLMAIGDIRHVLLSSIQLAVFQRTYQVSVVRARQIVAELARLFNYRFEVAPARGDELLESCGARMELVPSRLRTILCDLIALVCDDPRLNCTLKRSQCLGNLIVAAAIYRFLPPEITSTDLETAPELLHAPIFAGLQYLAVALGTGSRAVMPCTTIPSQLRLVYANGVMTTGESKSSSVRRGVPVESAHVDFCGQPLVHSDIITDIEEADILIFAPGSLYSSIIPVLKVPGLAEAVRCNDRALKVLVSNLWVQAGETDLSMADPERKFRVSDMLRAYERNIPGGTEGLFNEVLCLSLKDVPASVIQSYAVEGKIPIYLDREVVRTMGYIPVECGIYSKQALAERGVIQHDPAMLATAIKVLYSGADCFGTEAGGGDRRGVQRNGPAAPTGDWHDSPSCRLNMLPNLKYRKIREKIFSLTVVCGEECQVPCCGGSDDLKAAICEIIWKHHDIPLAHLEFIAGVCCVPETSWGRDQKWDNVYSFYDPGDKMIKIRKDQFLDKDKLEVALLIAIGESLLGNYAKSKSMHDLVSDGISLGKVYHLHIERENKRTCYLSSEQLGEFLKLARMHEIAPGRHYTRLINGDEGFTPPGLLMGLTYAWYLENRLATHIEYKMTVMKIPQTDLIPEQKRIVGRRQHTVSFFREVIFR